MLSEITKERAEEIFKENSEYVFRLALFLVKSKELADDITQETFLKVFRKYHTFDSSMPIKPWINKITVNVTRNMLRKQKWLKFVGTLPEESSSNFIESSILRTEEENKLWTEINNLNVKSKEIIVMHFYLGMKLREISDCLGIPLGTCKSRLNTALNTLRIRIPNNEFEFLNEGGGTLEVI